MLIRIDHTVQIWREGDVSIIRNNMKTAGMTRERYLELLTQV